MPAARRSSARSTGGELLAQVLLAALVELVLVEVGREVAGVELVGLLAVVLVPEAPERPLDAAALRRQELARTIRIHDPQLTLRAVPRRAAARA